MTIMSKDVPDPFPGRVWSADDPPSQDEIAVLVRWGWKRDEEAMIALGKL